MAFESSFKAIDNTLHHDDGCIPETVHRVCDKCLCSIGCLRVTNRQAKDTPGIKVRLSRRGHNRPGRSPQRPPDIQGFPVSFVCLEFNELIMIYVLI